MLVNNATDLQNVGLAGTYALGTNIDATSIPNFVPIAPDANWNDPSGGFAGIFDGQRHTISNLKVNAPSVDYSQQSVGLFGKIGTSGIVRNLGLINESVSGGYWNAGGLAGENYGSVANAYTTGSVHSSNPSNDVGGLIGNNDGSISNSYSTSAVTSTAGSGSPSTVGGLVGWNGGNLPSATISNSYSTGAVSAAGTYIGGFAGENDGTISRSYWDTQASGQTSIGVGSVVGSTDVTGLTTAQLQSGTLPTGFSSTAWIAAAGHYPALGWQAQLISGTVFSGSSPLSSATVSGLANGATIGSTTTDGSGYYSFSLFPGSGTNVLTYLTGASTGNTFSDGGTNGTYTGMNIYTGSLRLISGTKNTYSGMISALGTALGSNSGSNFLFTLNAGALSLTGGTNLSSLNSAPSFTVDQSITGPGSVFVSTTGNLTLSSGKSLSAIGSGDALVLTTGGAFTNNAGSGALSVTGGGRWLVYSQNPVSDTLGGLGYNFKQYNETYGSTVAQATGNGLLYAYAPILNVSLTGTSAKVYDGGTNAALSNSNYSVSGVVTGDTVSLNNPATGTYNDKNVGTAKAVSVSGAAFASATSGAATVYGYQISSSAASGNIGTITAKPVSALVAANNKVYDASTVATGTTGSLTGVVAGDNVTFAGSDTYRFTNKNVGTGKTVTESGLTLTGADSGNYSLGVLTGTADIAAKQLTATITASNKIYDGNSTAAATQGALAGVAGADLVNLAGTASYSFIDKNVGTGKTVTESGLTLAGADAGNYTLGALTGTANITAKQLTAAVTASNKVYDGTATATAVTGSLTGTVGSDDVSLNGIASYTFANKNVGAAKIVTESGVTLSGADAGNYTLGPLTTTADITARQLNAIVTANNKVYDGTTAATAGTGLLTGVVGTDDVALSGIASYAFSDRNAELGKTVTATGLSLTGTGAGNYTLGALAGTADITAKPLSAILTANNKVYDGTTAAAASLGPLTGAVGADNVNVSGAASYAFANKNVGVGKTVTATGLGLTGTDAGNYALATIAGTADITARQLTAAVTASNKVYDGTTVATGTVGSLNRVIGADDVTFSGTDTYHFSTKNVGTGKTVTESGLSLAGVDAGNYTLGALTGAADITAKQLSAAITASDKIYDGTTGAVGVSGPLTGTVAGDDVALSGSANYNFSDKNVGNGKTVTASGLSLGGADAPNYSLNVQNGVANITPAVLSASFAASNKIYDSTTSATGSFDPLAGVIGGDHVTLSGTPAYNFSDKNAGSGKTVNASGVALSGSDAGNYVLVVPSATASITPATIDLSISANNKVYDGATAATGAPGSLGGALGTDNLTLSGIGSYQFADKNVGRGKPVTEAGLMLGGTDASNYVLNVHNGVADINPAALTTNVAAVDKIYDGTAAASGSISPLAGAVGGDDVALTGTAAYTFADKNVGAGKPVTASGLALAGADAGNYSLNVQSGAASISPATITTSLSASSKIYDGTTTATASLGALSGVLGSDDVTLGGIASYNFPDKNVGSAKTVTASGLALRGPDTGNYVLNVQHGAADITPAMLTASLIASNKTYDGTRVAIALAGDLNGVLGSDTVSIGGPATYIFSDKNVGHGKIVSQSGLVLNGPDAANYMLNVQSGVADITPATLVLTSDASSRAFGKDNPAFTGTVTGFVNGETLASATTGKVVFTSPATGASAAGSYAINGSGLVANAGNYTFEEAASNAAALTVVPVGSQPAPGPIPTPTPTPDPEPSPTPAPGTGPSAPIAITISINNATRLANQPNPQFSATYTGPDLKGLDVASLIAQLSFQTDATTTAKPGRYLIGAAGQAPGIVFNIQPGILTVIDNSPKTIPTQVTVQPAATAVVASSGVSGSPADSEKSAGNGSAGPSLPIPGPVGPNMLGSFEMNYSVNWSKLFDSSISQSKPIAESSFVSPGLNQQNTVKSYAGGAAH